MEVNHEIQLTSRTFDGFIKKTRFLSKCKWSLSANGIWQKQLLNIKECVNNFMQNDLIRFGLFRNFEDV